MEYRLPRNHHPTNHVTRFKRFPWRGSQRRFNLNISPAECGVHVAWDCGRRMFPGFLTFCKTALAALSRHDPQHKVVAILFFGFIGVAAFSRNVALTVVVGVVASTFLIAYLIWSIVDARSKERAAERVLRSKEERAAASRLRQRAKPLRAIVKEVPAPLTLPAPSVQDAKHTSGVKKPRAKARAEKAPDNAGNT